MDAIFGDLPLIGGATFVSAAIVVFWRMFTFVVRDRDYWRAKTMSLLDAVDEDLDVQEKVVSPLKKVVSIAEKRKQVDEETIALIVKAVQKSQ